MWSELDHMNGFEKESTLAAMHGHPQVFPRLYMREDFMKVARILNPELCLGAFERRPCTRKLRFIGGENVEDQSIFNSIIRPYFYSKIYHSVDFNGATYTIRETGLKIGMAYFEVVV